MHFVQILLDVFEVNRITFKRFVEDPKIVDQSDLVIRYDSKSVFVSCRSSAAMVHAS